MKQIDTAIRVANHYRGYADIFPTQVAAINLLVEDMELEYAEAGRYGQYCPFLSDTLDNYLRDIEYQCNVIRERLS